MIVTTMESFFVHYRKHKPGPAVNLLKREVALMEYNRALFLKLDRLS